MSPTTQCTESPGCPQSDLSFHDDERLFSESVSSCDISSLNLADLATPEASHSTTISSTNRYKKEKLFLLCHGCIGAVMIQFDTTCDLSSCRYIVRSGHSTLVLTTCRPCAQRLSCPPSQDLWCPPRLDEFFHLLRLSPLMIEQMHAFQVMQVIARDRVLVLTHKDGVAYESWNTIFSNLPSQSICSGIVTDMRQGLVRDRLVLPHVPAILL
jgi:hypothetical protein